MHPNPRNRRLFITARAGSPLQALLAAHLANPDEAASLISCGAVWLDRRRLTDPGFQVERGRTVRLFLRPGQTEPYRLNDNDLVYRDSRVLAVFKPPGIPVQADLTSLCRNLARGVADRLLTEGNTFRPTPVSRLDVPVSGLVLFGAAKQWEKELFRLMRERKIHKAYCAVLCEAGPSRLLIDDPLGWDNGRARSVPAGRPARSLFLRGNDWRDLPRYTVIPFTGRRHQIRCHASGHIAPIAGDSRYGAPGRSDIQGIALACVGYNFTLGGTRYRIRLPESMCRDHVADLKSAATTT